MDATHAAADAIPMLVRSRAERRRVFLRSRSRALVQSGVACEGLDTWTTLPWNRATDLVDKDMSRSKARQVELYVDGHAVG